MNALDRCDSCNAQARAVAEFQVGELLFCGHHWKKHKSVIIEIAQSYYAEPEFDIDIEKELVKIA